MKLLRNHRFEGISKKPGTFRAEEGRVSQLEGTRGNHVTEADIDLKREPRVAKGASERQPDATVLSGEPDGLSGHGSRVEADAVVLDLKGHALPHHRDELRGACAPATQEVNVLGGPW